MRFAWCVVAVVGLVIVSGVMPAEEKVVAALVVAATAWLALIVFLIVRRGRGRPAVGATVAPSQHAAPAGAATGVAVTAVVFGLLAVGAVATNAPPLAIWVTASVAGLAVEWLIFFSACAAAIRQHR